VEISGAELPPSTNHPKERGLRYCLPLPRERWEQANKQFAGGMRFCRLLGADEKGTKRGEN